MNIDKEEELMESPLQRLEFHVKSGRSREDGAGGDRRGDRSSFAESRNFDRDSLYSFDSVSTSGRLLDRLGFENDEYLEDGGFDGSKRESVVSVQSTGRLLDRLGLDEDEYIDASSRRPTISRNSRSGPSPVLMRRGGSIKDVPLATIGRQSSYTSNSVLARNQISERLQRPPNLRGFPNDNALEYRTGPASSIFRNGNTSVDSFKADLGTLSNNSSQGNIDQINQASPLTQISSAGRRGHDSHTSKHTPPQSSSLGFSTGETPVSHGRDGKFPVNSTLQAEEENAKDIIQPRSSVESSEDKSSNGGAPSTPKSLQAPSTPLMRSASMGTNVKDLPFHTPSPRRIVSDSVNSTPTAPTTEISPEYRIRMASELRTSGRNREASYQLRLAASGPEVSPKAMYLYGFALKMGQGVKQNDRHALKWMCKCILASGMKANSHLLAKLNSLEPDDMIPMISRELKSVAPADPNDLYDQYHTKQSQQGKPLNISKLQADVVSASYHEIGNSLISGAGLSSKDELTGIDFLVKSASMGYVNSMVQLGDLWCIKTKAHKKDVKKAAAWLRLSELFGVKSIGNSWIYKDKYLDKKR